MKRFIQGEHRGQITLLPDSLADYVSDTNPVRVVDVFVDELDLAALGFDGVLPAETGRPAYHPAILLKIYIYGYLNRIQSSGRLEREAQRNVELMWLTGRLMPDFKTIANFRKDNSKAIRGVCRQFVVLCQQLGLFGENLVAIDGSKFKAVNNRDRNFTSAKLKRRMEEIESSINRYLAALDSADRKVPTASKPDATGLEEKIQKLKTQMKELQVIESKLNDSPDKQVSLTDPDARSMMTRGNGIVGYNVQTAVDTQHHLIVAHEVTNVGPDRDQLSLIPKLAQLVAEKLQIQWSPEQIAGRLKRTYPDATYQVSHETIYRSLFIQARGALKKELLEHLRRSRAMRRSRHHTQKTENHGRISDTLSISERPAVAEDRAVPGHREGDLLCGSKNSLIATLVERRSRYVMLVKVKGKDTETVVNALIENAQRLPQELYRSLTWDRGKEMAGHKRFTLATDIQVYFCDPQNPWQRGTNENTNGLLRQYFPKGTDLSLYSQDELDHVARQLNERPRKTLGYSTPVECFNHAVASTG